MWRAHVVGAVLKTEKNTSTLCGKSGWVDDWKPSQWVWRNWARWAVSGGTAPAVSET